MFLTCRNSSSQLALQESPKAHVAHPVSPPEGDIYQGSAPNDPLWISWPSINMMMCDDQVDHVWTVVEGGRLSLLCENVIFQFCLTFRNKMSCTNIPPNQNKVCKHKLLTEWFSLYSVYSNNTIKFSEQSQMRFIGRDEKKIPCGF